MRARSTSTLSHQAVLPNLDALRFLAFLGVMLAHAYQPLIAVDPNNASFYEAMHYGVLGVNFFFVLSGFLITRLLLNDVVTTGKPRLARFYKRRVLRIWPLYAVVLLLAALHYALVDVDANTRWWYFVLFLGNFHILIEGFPYSPALANLWTIAVEEQFYLVAPLLLWWFRKRIWIAALCLVIASAAFRFFVATSRDVSNDHLYFNTLSVMNDLSVGMLLACVAQRFKPNAIRVNGLVQALVTTSFAACIVWFQFVDAHVFTATVERIILALLFALIVFQQVFVSNRGFDVQRVPGFNYLGKISYGLYMYHAFAIQLAVLMFEQLNVAPTGWLGVAAFPLCVLAVSFAAAALSFEFFEKKILRLKSAWAP